MELSEVEKRNVDKKYVIEFLHTFNELVLDLVDAPKFNDFGNAVPRLVNLVHYNSFLDDRTIFIGLIPTLVYLECNGNRRPQCEEKLKKKLYILGWILVMTLGSIDMKDDYFDQSLIRGLNECWHKRENRGHKTIHDIHLLRSSINILLRKHFGQNEKLLRTAVHVFLKYDVCHTFERLVKYKKDLQNLSQSWLQFQTLLKYETIGMKIMTETIIEEGMRLAGIDNDEAFEQMRALNKICFERIKWTDDHMDAFGNLYNPLNPNDLMTTGNDIEQGNLAAPILYALEVSDSQQKQLLLENYGKGMSNPDAVSTVRRIFADLKVRELLLKYEEEEASRFSAILDNAVPGLPKRCLYGFYNQCRVPTEQNQREAYSFVNEDQESLTHEMSELGTMMTHFAHTFADIITILKNHAEKERNDGINFSTIMPWITRLMCYNVPLGKKARGFSTVMAYKAFKQDATSEEIRRCCFAGWAAEMLQAAALMADDLQDSSVTRRGQPCWYLKNSIGNTAMSDVQLLTACSEYIMEEVYGNEPYFINWKKLLSDMLFKTLLGQGFDIINGMEKNLDKFTPETYQAIVKYKTAYYTFYLPVAVAMVMCGEHTPEKARQVKAILLDIGCYFQAQDDFLDCFGDEKTIGKVGTDIADGKCSWLVVSALELATDEQKLFIKDNYGKGLADKEKIESIKQLYVKLGLPEKFQEYEDNTYDLLRQQIDLLDNFTESQKNLIHKVLNNTYKRKF